MTHVSSHCSVHVVWWRSFTLNSRPFWTTTTSLAHHLLYLQETKMILPHEPKSKRQSSLRWVLKHGGVSATIILFLLLLSCNLKLFQNTTPLFDEEPTKDEGGGSFISTKWNPNLSKCTLPGVKYSGSTMQPRVALEYIKKITQGGWENIERGSGPVDLVGFFTMFLSKLQHKAGIFGSVCELGVHHGRYTSTLFITAREHEKLIVADVFGQQEKNVDNSGLGDKEKFLASLAEYGLSSSDLHTLFTGSTEEIPKDWSVQEGFEQFRLISVDAGHTSILTRNDLLLSTCNLLQGGVVVIDDLYHPHWHGVTEGMHQFFSSMTEPYDLYPFLHCEQKLFMTNDREKHGKYYEALAKDARFTSFLIPHARKYGGSTEFLMNGVPFLQCDGRGDVDVASLWTAEAY